MMILLLELNLIWGSNNQNKLVQLEFPAIYLCTALKIIYFSSTGKFYELHNSRSMSEILM